MANRDQIRRIHAIGRSLGISTGDRDDALHDLIRAITGKESIRDLEEQETAAVIRELARRQGRTSPAVNRTSAGHAQDRPGSATAAQQRKILALLYELEKRSPSEADIGARLRGVIRAELGIDVVPYREFEWIKFEEAHRLIEALKGYVATAGRAKRVGG